MKLVKYVIGIDAGFVHTGISVFKVLDGGGLKFHSCKTIGTEKVDKKKQVRVADDDADRMMKLVIEMDKFLSETCAGSSNVYCVIELPTGGSQGARANRTMGMITGVIVTYVTIKDIPVEYVTPNDVKIAITGKKTANKDEIMNKVRKILGKYDLPKTKVGFEHVADSVGAVLHARKFSQIYKIFINK